MRHTLLLLRLTLLLLLLLPDVLFPLLYRYKSTCFTGTKVQTLTQKALVGARRPLSRSVPTGGSSWTRDNRRTGSKAVVKLLVVKLV